MNLEVQNSDFININPRKEKMEILYIYLKIEVIETHMGPEKGQERERDKKARMLSFVLIGKTLAWEKYLRRSTCSFYLKGLEEMASNVDQSVWAERKSELLLLLPYSLPSEGRRWRNSVY